MVMLAKVEVGGAAGLYWDTAGEKGAQEVDFRLANELLAIPGDHFFVVSPEAKKSEEKGDNLDGSDEPEVKEVKTRSKKKVETPEGSDLAEALSVADGN